MRKRILSGAQPTGNLHIGNFFGALQNWIKLQYDFDSFFFIADLHAITKPGSISPSYLRNKTKEFIALYISCGLDMDKSTLFIQSMVPAHTELAWILNCYTPMGWLERMTQFKSKASDREKSSIGLFSYPVLQAADILLYDSDFVPVGEDQKQHLELTRDIADRFNNHYGDIFKKPEPYIPKTYGARLMGLDNPEKKMSKSISESKKTHAIGLLDEHKVVKSAIMKAVTGTEVNFNYATATNGVKNLMEIYHLLSGESYDNISSRYTTTGYGQFKKDLLELTISFLTPIQNKYHELIKDETFLFTLAEKGAEKANYLANKKLRNVKEAIGICQI